MGERNKKCAFERVPQVNGIRNPFKQTISVASRVFKRTYKTQVAEYSRGKKSLFRVEKTRFEVFDPLKPRSP